MANPLDYHTYIWRDVAAMTQAFSAMLEPHLAITLLVVDFPRPGVCDPSDWECAIEAAIAARRRTSACVGMVATLPELMPEETAQRLLDGGVIPFAGLETAFAAIAAAQPTDTSDQHLPLLAFPHPPFLAVLLDEASSKREISNFGLEVPSSVEFSRIAPPASVAWPAALKGLGFAHKTEADAVILDIRTIGTLTEAIDRIGAENYLLEEMVEDGVAELLIGVTLDPAHGFVMTIGSGGTLTELLQDTKSLMVPSSREGIYQSLKRLKCFDLLKGYRGKPSANVDAVLDAIEAVQAYVVANANNLSEVEVNPLICTPTRAVAVDALIRRRP